MADAKIILRVFSKAGRSRVELPQSSSFNDLKTEIGKRLNLDARGLALFRDDKLRDQIKGSSAATLVSLRLKNGDIIHVGNQEAKMDIAPPKPKRPEDLKPAPTANDGSEQIDTSMKSESSKPAAAKDEEPAQKKCNHSSNQKCLNCLGVTKENFQEVKAICQHQADQKCPNCIYGDEREVKHDSFDKYVLEQKKKCAKKHAPHQKCQNCTFSQQLSYKVDFTCKKHKPYPLGMCNKCLPPAVVLTRQTYRHVDYVSFMNFKELSSFVGHWQRSGCLEQRMAYLYGYFSEDPNFPEGIRCNVEAVYEPPQIGEINGFQELEDHKKPIVEMIASGLQLECVGWIFTKVDQDTIFTSNEARKVAAMQEQHSFDHPEGMKVSKFVTVVVSQKGGDAEVECYMISDQGQALERDNVFGESDNRKMMKVRVPPEDDMVPSIVTKGKTVKEFEPEFFIVSLAHGQPKEGQNFNIMKIYDFPVMNRDSPATMSEFKGYMKKYKAVDSNQRFACFQLLLYIAEVVDIDTAITIANNVAEEQKLDPALIELLESF